ncbi:MAG: hypothetical protein KJN72_12210 [Woeseia sp.]|nr:hypothetical protein [Woeseia sp.]
MAGILPDEGENLVLELLIDRVLTDRDADLELGLFTNTTAPETITEATVTEPTGGSYARKTLTDATWTGDGTDSRAYAQQTFTATGGAYTGSVYGYFIATKSAGGTQRLVAIEVDPNGPYTFAENDTYDITPNITAA